jgi:predicted dehydrogenase
MPDNGRGITRRSFLKIAGAAAAAPCVVASSTLGLGGTVAPSNRIAMGFIGVGTQGGGHLVGGAWTYLTGGYVARDDVQVLAVCDIVRPRREERTGRVNAYYAEKLGKGSYKAAEAYNDFRDVLARLDVDAVLIATPVHWHSLMSVMAAKAGKDVYCEKPVSLTVREGRAMADAIHRYGRVFQAGTQQRSCYGGKFRRACELVRSGRIGQLKSVYAMLGGGGFNPGPGPTGRGAPVPDGVDWELFLGPAPWTPYPGGLDAHMFGWGSINWGQHHYDIVQWGIGSDDTGPVEIGWEDGKLACKYACGVTVYGCPYPGEKVGGTGGCTFVGTEGRLAVDREWLVSYPPKIAESPLGPNDVHLYKSNDHAINFLDCVRTRKRTISDVETAHRAMSVILLGGIAEQLKRPLKWDPAREQFAGDPEADRMLSVAQRPPWHL